MVIDLILDRKDGTPYRAHDFYFGCLNYGKVADGITRAMDYGEEEDVQRELCNYIDRNEYNSAINDYIRSVTWLEDDKQDDKPENETEFGYYYPGSFWAEEFNSLYEDSCDNCGGYDDSVGVYTVHKLLDRAGNRHLIHEYDDYAIDNTIAGQSTISKAECERMISESSAETNTESETITPICCAVINGRIAVEVTPNTPGAWYKCGTWYLYENDYEHLIKTGK